MTFHPALFKPQVTVAICCQGDQTTTASHSWQTSSHSHAERKYMVHGPQLSFKKKKKIRCGLDLFWLVEKLDDTSTNPVSAVRAVCVLVKIFASPQRCTKMQVWMYYLYVFFF